MAASNLNRAAGIAHSRGSYGALVGNTPLIVLSSLSADLGAPIWGKCEFMNPTGSVKDRIAHQILDELERRGVIKTGRTRLYEATAGNTGVALAAASAGRGYALTVTMSDKMGADKVALMKAWGAHVVLCPYDVDPGDPRSFIRTARRLAERDPDGHYVNQFEEPANVRAHYETTGPEIFAALDGHVSVLVAGAGTGGTLTGTARFLRERCPKLTVVLADPVGSILGGSIHGRGAVEARPYLVEGIGGDFLPPLLDRSLVDVAIAVPDCDAFAMCKRLQREDGLFVGGSSGCVVAAAIRYRELNPQSRGNIVIVLADRGDRYQSTIYSDDWLATRGVLPGRERA